MSDSFEPQALYSAIPHRTLRETDESVLGTPTTSRVIRSECSIRRRPTEAPEIFTTVDQRIEQEIQALLSRNLNQCSRNIIFDVQDGHVLMKGVVPSYYFKQLAQESARRVDGVLSIVNQIRVSH